MGWSLCVALQGGGSHGAYSWGVLERLLEERDIRFEALSGASAGAMNAAVLACGYTTDGAAGARDALARFWAAVGARSLSAYATPPGLADPLVSAYVSLSHYFSPYQLNPLNINPLREILNEQLDFALLRKRSRIRLFVSATRVRDGGLRLFTERDLTADALLASACVPSLHHTVQVDGEEYWDGALTANPPLSSLVYSCRARDILLVALTAPSTADRAPTTADAIRHRFTDIGFSSACSTELHSIRLAQVEAQRARYSFGTVDRKLRRLRLSVIDAAQDLDALDGASRMKADTALIEKLRSQGRKRAEEWLRGTDSRIVSRARPTARSREFAIRGS